MTNVLYLFLLYPIEVLMQWCLEAAYLITQSYGVAIVMLSVCVNYCILPLYTMAESWQQKERDIKLALDPGVQHIKKAFKGQERFAMLNTLYRQHRYHPVMGLRTSLGLLIQIPFFFAAYHFLSNYQPLNGVPFLWLEDLALPDGLLRIGTMSLNVLPFVMTAVNLCAAHVYSKKLARGEKTQFYVLAAVFLILLYNSPSALVLYWTINNLFSLAKNIVEQKLTATSLATGLSSLIDRITPSARGLIVVVAVLAVNVALIETGALSKALEKPATFTSFALLFYLSIIALGVFMTSFSVSIVMMIRALLIMALYAISFFYLVDALSPQQYYHTLEQERWLVWSGFALISVLSLANLSLLARRFPIAVEGGHGIFILSASLAAAVICVFSPISLYVSDAALFSISVIEVVSGTSLIGLMVILLLSGTYFATVSHVRGYCVLAMACVAILVCLYSFVLTGDYGSIDFFTLDEQSFSSAWLLALDLLMIVLVAVVVFSLFKRKHWRFTTQMLAILLATTLSASGYQLYTLDTPISDGHLTSEVATQGLAALPDYNKDLLSFSRRGKNIVIIMLDGFNAYTLPGSLARAPELRKNLDGFVWYRNTLTTGYVTALGEPGIHGGHRYTSVEIAKREYQDISDETARGYQAFSDSFGESGFGVSYAGVQNARCEKVVLYSRKPPRVCVEDNYIDDYVNTIAWPGRGGESDFDFMAGAGRTIDYKKVLIAIGVFRAAPFSLKEAVYDDGTWLDTYPLAQKITNGAKRSARNLAALNALSKVSAANSERSTFKYIQNNLTHRPFYIDATTCIPSLKATSDEAARDCALRSIIEWLGWLKSEEIYDNTMVVLVSDHGSRRFGYSLGMGIPLIRANALLMVKDYDRRGDMTDSEVFMSNADVPAIVCATIGGCPSIGPDPRLRPESRTLYLVKGNNKKNYHRISDENIVYQVKDSIFDTTNWSIVK